MDNNKIKQKQKVFTIKAYGYYSGGMAVVAAPTIEEAKKIALKNPNKSSMWCIEYDRPESIQQLPLEYHGPPMVLTIFEVGE